MSSTATTELRPAANGTGATPVPLQLTVTIDGDPVRFARIVSAVTNNTPAALYEASVAERIVYPVGRPVDGGGTVSLRFRPRNPARTMDGLLLEQIAASVRSVATVLDIKTGV